MLKYKEKIYNLCELSPLIQQHISTEKDKKQLQKVWHFL